MPSLFDTVDAAGAPTDPKKKPSIFDVVDAQQAEPVQPKGVMGQPFWRRAVEAAKAIPDVARLMFEEPGATLQGAEQGMAEGAMNVAPTIARTGGAMGGAALGTMVAPGVGTAAGGAIGAGLGEALAEKLEGRSLNPYQIATQGALGAVPILGSNPVARVAQGAALGGVGSAATDLAEGRPISLAGVAQGVTLGGGMGAAFERFGPKGGPVADVATEVPDVQAVPRPAAELPENFGPAAYAGPERRSVSRNAADDAEFARRRQTEIQQKMQSGEMSLEDTVAKRPDVAMKEAGEEARRAQAAAEGRPKGRGGAPTTVRLYHGGADDSAGGGRWFSSDPEYAKAYAEKSGGSVSYVDLPADHPLIKPEYPEQGIAQGFHQNLELPEDIARTRQPLAPVQETPAISNNEQLGPVNTETRRPSTRSMEQVAKAMGAEIPAQKPLDSDRRAGESVFFDKLPEPLREGVQEVVTKNGGFEGQRRGVQPVERTQRLADYIQVESTKALPRGTALNAEELTAYARATATVQDKINGLAEKVNNGTATAWDQAALLLAREEQGIVAANYLGARAETGRALRIQQSLVDAFESKDVTAIKAALENPKIRKDLEGFAKKWATLDSDEAKLTFLRDSKENTWGDTLRAVYFSNILSGVKTHARNIIGNTANNIFSNVSMLPALGYDVARSAVTGAPRTVFAKELSQRAVGTALGVKQGIDDALFTVTHGYTPKSLATFDIPRPELKGGGKNPFNWTGRALEAEDQLFYGIAYNQELYSRLYAKARAEASKRGLTGEAMGGFIEDRLASWKMNPPKDVSAATEQAAKRMVYKEDPGQFVQKIIALKEGGGALGKTLNFVLPFVKTPGNIIRQGVEATPLGAFTSQGRAALAAGGRESAESIGRMTTGTVGLAALAYLASKGLVSGNGPKDPEQRAALMERGWRPMSVKIGDTWVDYSNAAQPMSQPLFAIANAWEQYHATGKAPNVAEIAAGTGGALLDQSFLSGVSDLNSAISDPQRYGAQYASRLAQGFVPFSGLARNVAQGIDPVVRDPKGSVAAGVASVVPGLSQTVNPKLDRFGAEVKRPGTAIERAISPVTRSKESKDPVVLELERLKVDSLGLPPTKLQETKRFPARELSVQERSEIGQATRAALEKLFAHPSWGKLDEDVARDRIGKAVHEARYRATQAIRRRG